MKIHILYEKKSVFSQIFFPNLNLAKVFFKKKKQQQKNPKEKSGFMLHALGLISFLGHVPYFSTVFLLYRWIKDNSNILHRNFAIK